MFFRRSKTPAPTDIDGRLAAFDRAYAGMFPNEPKPWESSANADQPVSPARARLMGKTRWWWFTRASAGLLLLFILIVFWLAVTAPLSKSLQPIAPPQSPMVLPTPSLRPEPIRPPVIVPTPTPQP